jgi:hypothetical protein
LLASRLNIFAYFSVIDAISEDNHTRFWFSLASGICRIAKQQMDSPDNKAGTNMPALL